MLPALASESWPVFQTLIAAALAAPPASTRSEPVPPGPLTLPPI